MRRVRPAGSLPAGHGPALSPHGFSPTGYEVAFERTPIVVFRVLRVARVAVSMQMWGTKRS